MLGSRILVGLLVGMLAGVPGHAAARTLLVDACTDRVHDVDPARSLFVSEVEVLENAFTLKELLRKLVRDAREPGLTPRLIWDEWWDTQNTAPGLDLGAHCDDNGLDNAQPPNGFLNGYPVQCPRAEAQEIDNVPFEEDNPQGSHYKLIALVNRFDLAPEDGSHCGEYRAVFARVAPEDNGSPGEDGPGVSGGGRNLVIFEAVLPNPGPSCELEGCRAIARYWESLSSEEDPVRRGEKLRRFFLFGLPEHGVEPAIALSHLTKGTGQVRSNMFLDPEPNSGVVKRWQLREFKLARICRGSASEGPCRFRVVPVSVKKNPFGPLFSDTPGRFGLAFKRHFQRQVKRLMNPDINRFDYDVPNFFNAGQSDAQGAENHYPNQLPEDPDHFFRARLAERLERLGSEADPVQLVRRAHVLSCGGCHNPPVESLPPALGDPGPGDGLGDGMFWADSNGFTHVTETVMDPEVAVPSFKTSDALKEIFVPHREGVFERFLNAAPCEDCTPVYLADGGGGVDPASASIVVGEDEPLAISSEALEALDAVLKQGISDRRVGGASRSH